MSEIIAKLMSDIVGRENVKTNALMSEYTTFKVGGPADYFVEPNNIEEVKKIVKLCKSNGISFFIIGNGSNLLVKDEGYAGAIIQLYKNMSRCRVEGDVVIAEAGIKLSNLSEILCKNSLGGFEFASGIPGTLGGAISMNAGAYGGEMKDIVSSAIVLDGEGNVKNLTHKELDLGYRTSTILKRNYILVEAELRLEKADQQVIKNRILDLKNKREDKQPLEYPSAGSTFKRPEGYFAGKLIMDAGLSGYRVGNAMVSEKHCGFVINAGGATAKDIIAVINDVVRIVRDKFGVTLEPEVKIL